VVSEDQPTVGRFAEILAEDVTFRSPVLANTVRGRELVQHVLANAHAVFGRPTYLHELRDGGRTMLHFEGAVDGKRIEVAVAATDDGELVGELAVMMRPLTVVEAFARYMDARLPDLRDEG